jgi:hypothetical protein
VVLVVALATLAGLVVVLLATEGAASVFVEEIETIDE